MTKEEKLAELENRLYNYRRFVGIGDKYLSGVFDGLYNVIYKKNVDNEMLHFNVNTTNFMSFYITPFISNCGTLCMSNLQVIEANSLSKLNISIDEINLIFDIIQKIYSRVMMIYICPINKGYEEKENFLKLFKFRILKESGFFNVNSTRNNYIFCRILEEDKHKVKYIEK